MLEWMQFLALLTCAGFTGAAIYISLVEHPARMKCGRELAATVFGPSYRRAARMQASLALLSFLSGAAAGWMGQSLAWLVGALLMFAVIPFTLVAILPTNRRLLDPALDRSSPEAEELLTRWGRLHAVRSILGLAALVLFAANLAFA